MDVMQWATKFKERIGPTQGTFRSWWKKKAALLEEKIGDHVHHIFRGHNQEADNLANMAGRWHTFKNLGRKRQ